MSEDDPVATAALAWAGIGDSVAVFGLQAEGGERVEIWTEFAFPEGGDGAKATKDFEELPVHIRQVERWSIGVMECWRMEEEENEEEEDH